MEWTMIATDGSTRMTDRRTRRAAAALVAVGIVCGLAPAVADETIGVGRGTGRGTGRDAFRRGELDQAKLEVDRAYREGGQGDFEIVLLRGHVAYRLADPETAFEMLEVAGPLAAGRPGMQARLEDLRTHLDADFGAVTLVRSPKQTARLGRIDLEVRSQLLPRLKREAFARAHQRLAQPRAEPPVTAFLPHGHYVANDVPFSLSPDVGRVSVQIYLRDPVEAPAREVARDDGTLWWVVAAGGAAAAVAGVAAYFLIAGDEGGHRTETVLVFEG